jgi:probable F420-dependent oxidoreductase
VKFGLQMVVGTRHYAEVARLAEEAGFDALVVPDHLVYPPKVPATYPYADDGVLRINGVELLAGDLACYDPFVQLGFLAACTSRVKLMTGVCIAPLYHPIFLARSLATVDRMSGGRVELGIGIGWLEEEFDAAGWGFKDRGRRTDRIVEVLRQLWTNDVIEVHDEWFDFGPVKFNPKPLGRPAIPIHIGGASKPALRRIGTHGDGYIEIGSKSLEEVLEKKAVIDEARRAADRAHLPFETSSTPHALPDIDAIQRAEEAGITRVIVIPWSLDGGPLTPQAFKDWADHYHDLFISKVGT